MLKKVFDLLVWLVPLVLKQAVAVTKKVKSLSEEQTTPSTVFVEQRSTGIYVISALLFVLGIFVGMLTLLLPKND